MRLTVTTLLPFAVVSAGLVFCGAVRANDVYVAQSATGSANGSSCANGYAISFFNSSGNWTSGSPSGTQIGPGTTVHLCGTITGALTAQGSGSSGSPITILFDSASAGQISMPALPGSGALVLNNQSYITVDGNNGVGVIQSTSNGSPASLCSGSTYANDIMSVGITANASNYIEVKNLTIGPLYVHTCNNDESTTHSALSPPGAVCVAFNGSNNVTVDGNTLHDAAWCLNGSGNNISVHNNTIYNMDHGLGMGSNANSGTMTGIYFYNNNVYGAGIWDTNDNSFHHDGIHLFAYCSNGSSFCSANSITNIYVYNNHFYGTWGNNVNCLIFFEENIKSAYVFNNYADGSQMISYGAGMFQLLGDNISSFNNTIAGWSTNNSQGSAVSIGGPGTVVQNNVYTTFNSLVGTSATDTGGTMSTLSLSNNVYASGGGNAWVWCPPTGGSCSWLGFSQFSTWVSNSKEVGAVTAASAGLTSSGTLALGSPAIQAGANLYSVCKGQPNPGLGALCSDASGNARPQTGPWDAGAFNYSSSTTVLPPTQLSAVTY
jgi:hypothetical protein